MQAVAALPEADEAEIAEIVPTLEEILRSGRPQLTPEQQPSSRRPGGRR